MQITQEYIDNSLEILRDTIKYNRRHPNYVHTVHEGEFWHSIMTGESQESMIVRYRATESMALKEQRVRLYNPITPFAANRPKSFFSRIHRADNIKEDLGIQDGTIKEKVQENLNNFFGGESLTKYLNETKEYYTFHDMNAALVINFKDERDPVTDAVVSRKAYPLEVTSRQLVNLKYDECNNLDWIIVEHKRIETVKNIDGKDEKVALSDFYLFRAGLTLHFSECTPGVAVDEGSIVEEVEVSADHKEPSLEKLVPHDQELKEKSAMGKLVSKVVSAFNYVVSTNETKPKRKFCVQAHNTGTKEIPARLFGDDRDPITFRQTRTSPLSKARHIFLDIIRDKSYLDITKTLHTFLKQYAYADGCTYEHPETKACCERGYLGGIVNESNVCPACHGMGVDVHTTEQETIFVALGDKENFIPLKDLVHYVQLPHETPKFQREELNLEINQVWEAVFVKDIFEAGAMGKTATEAALDYENIYNVIHTYASGYSSLWEFVVRITGQIHGGAKEDIKPDHSFPADYKMESCTTLIEKREKANKAGVPFSVVNSIDCDIMRKQNMNNIDDVEDIKAFEMFIPWRDKSIDVQRALMLDREPNDIDRVTWENSARIISEIQCERREKGEIRFYQIKDWKIRKKIFRDKAKEIVDEIKLVTADE